MNLKCHNYECTLVIILTVLKQLWKITWYYSRMEVRNKDFLTWVSLVISTKALYILSLSYKVSLIAQTQRLCAANAVIFGKGGPFH